jgi:ATP-dependent DNA helicase RecQ
MNSLKILKKYFDYSSFRSGQEEIINHILAEKNVLAILATGAGKSICYQIPALMGASFSIVISPLISLMQDQVNSINKIKTVAQFINSSLDFKSTEQILNSINNSPIKLLYLAPEKLENISFAERIKNLNPDYIFVDEAHCISEWGHNFRPSYRKIREFCDFIGCNKISAFTATATPEVREDIIEQLKLENPKVIVRGFERKNLSLNVEIVSNKKEKVFEILSNNELPAIVYNQTRKQSEDISNFLNLKGIHSEFYHAGLSTELRRLIQDNFTNGRTEVISATNAFGMGIDKQNIRTVIHSSIPSSIENYYQEIGRAGRDGLDSKVFLLSSSNDEKLQEFFISNNYPQIKELRIVYDGLCDSRKIALGSVNEKAIVLDKNLLSYFNNKGINQSKCYSAINILEDSGAVRITSELNKKHFVKFLLSKEQIRNYVSAVKNNELKNLIIVLLRLYGINILQKQIFVNIDKIVESTGLRKDIVYKNLETLANTGIAEYESPSKFKEIDLVFGRVESRLLNINEASLKQLESKARERVKKMLDYCSITQCRAAYILSYFGEDRDNYKCGICDNCIGKNDTQKLSMDYLKEIVLKSVHEGKGALKINDLIQILQGKSTKYFAKDYSAFGYCEFYSDAEIKGSLESLIAKNLLKVFKNKIYLNDEGKNILSKTKDAESSTLNYEHTLGLFNKLRKSRKQAAAKFGQSAQIICTDKILRNIAEKEPITPSELMSVEGFSQRMFNKVGEEFLFVIAEYIKSAEKIKKNNIRDIPKNLSSTLDLVQKGYSLKSISNLLKSPESIVSLQIEALLDYDPELKIDDLFDEEEILMIKNEIDLGTNRLKDLKQKLPSAISYSKIRIVLSKYRAR